MKHQPPPKDKDLKSLQAEWYAKLKDEGFDDIEQDEEHLKAWHSHMFKAQYSTEAFTAKESYYRAAGKFLHDYRFRTLLERAIWELHANGTTIMAITDSLKGLGYKTYRRHVHETIQRLSKIMLTRLKKGVSNE